ncbi:MULTISPECIES: patatin-like phospholipase family protein [unclassified Polaribacter]|uniref:patatin-like phospholipase family protein n=1 Tax=unclassified Polaribacter TaxID=196858 RepID=UPI0011BF7C37|nr:MULTISPECIES: patatin-like phospholipase family protein [unclassified Polaribacter]TXD51987.1 patatin-like phospholipase family protein [Polaribacter sp. IC063]TXD58656.1 patatin-like phospholipase family protein [Polaribacter sp. IC066]
MTTGLVLSGGGMRGVAHVGVFKALEEHNINITHIAGTSAGAIVGALFAAGHSWSTILKFCKEVPIFEYQRYAYKKPGFIDTSKFYKDLLPFFTEDDFKSLKKQLFIPTTNLIEGKEIVFNSGKLIKPILASAAFPGLFTPVIINDVPYADGGVLNNFPVEHIKDKCDKTIGVYVNSLQQITQDQLKHSYQVANRAYSISFASQYTYKFKEVDMLINPKELEKFGMFNLKNIDAIFEIGYQAALKALENYNN